MQVPGTDPGVFHGNPLAGYQFRHAHFALVAGNDMLVQMFNRTTCSRTHIVADIETKRGVTGL